MKALTKNCFLALLCLFGSETYSQVASPPTAGKAPAGAPVVVYGEIVSSDPLDSIKITYRGQHYGKSVKEPAPVVVYVQAGFGNLFEGVIPRKEQVFRAQVPTLDAPGYLSISTGRNIYLEDYVALPGDSIKFRVDHLTHQLVFAGPDAPAYRVQQQLRVAEGENSFSHNRSIKVRNRKAFLERDNFRALYDRANSQFGRQLEIKERGKEVLASLQTGLETLDLQDQLDILERYRPSLSPLRHEILMADLWGKSYRRFFYPVYTYLYPDAEKHHKKELLEELDSFYESRLSVVPIDLVGDLAAANSYHYIEYLLSRAKTIEAVKGIPVMETLEQNHQGQLRDRLVAQYLVADFKRLENGTELLKRAMEIVQDPETRPVIETLYSRKSTGQKAYAFDLPDPEGNRVKLDDFSGKTILVDFWYTGCKACIYYNQDQLAHLEENFGKREDFEIVSINADSDRNRWLSSLGKKSYTSPGSVNLYTEGEGFSHPLLNYYNVHTFPYQLLIDRHGKIYRAGGLRQLSGKELEELIRPLLTQPK